MKGSALPVLLMLLLSSCAQDQYTGKITYLGVGGGVQPEQEQLEGQVQFVRQIYVDEKPGIPEVGNLGFVHVVHDGKKAQFRVFVHPEAADPAKTFTRFEGYRDDETMALRYLRGYFKAVNSRVKTKGQVRYPICASREDGREDPFVDGFNDGIGAAKVLEQLNW